MTDSLDVPAAHKHFAARFFNAAWDLLDKDDKTHDEIDTMIDLAHASRMHWRLRADESPKTRSISAWLISRVYAMAGRPDEALRYGTDALDIARLGGVGDFYVGYGHEAVARAARAIGDDDTARLHLGAARDLLAGVDDSESRDQLAGDLDSIEN